jgi:2-oxoglutarate dehydrogenase E1 component
MRLAVAYRQRYNEDVFVDLLGYRKHGHNEGDEPRFTQPLLYKNIDKHPDIYQLYKKQLMEAGVIDAAQAELREKQYAAHLDEELEKSKKVQAAFVRPFLGARYSKFKKAGLADVEKSPATGLPKKTLQSWLQALNTLPGDKAFLKKIAKIFADRQEMVNNDRLDWALGEALAYASVLAEGGHVRLSGQDCVRGTFSHRHAIVRVEDSEEEYTPLNNLPGKKGPFNVYNSLLSEYAVLGFEYGYALGAPSGLTLWEAQFGDFNNGAQIVIDQYISSGEDKWHTQNGLVMLLPHGYEGQGAEHSSARLERFLNLCAELNMQVVNCTSPANFFHALRRQLHRPFRKPLVVMSPKSLLRHPQCVSSIDDFAGKTAFQEVIDDAEATSAKTTTLVFCSGKIYFELLERKRAENAGHIALIRIEQLFPFPAAQVNQIIEGYPAAKRFIWAQEEPENMGAWSFILRANHKSQKRVLPLEVIAQQASASPATGSPKEAARRQADIINRVFETPSAKNSTPRKATAKSA